MSQYLGLLWQLQRRRGIQIIIPMLFYTPPHNSGGVLLFHVGHLCVICLSVFSFPNDNLSKFQWIFVKLGMYIDVVEIWFGIANFVNF